MMCNHHIILLIGGIVFMFFMGILIYKTKIVSKSKKIAVDLLIINGTVIPMNQKKDIITKGAVAICDEVIIDIGTTTMLEPKYAAKKVINAQGCVILPGFINTHVHAAMSLFRGLADDQSLHDWLQTYIVPAEQKNVTPEFVYWGTKLACYEMIAGGTTTFVDMYFFEDNVAQAAYDMGMRAIVGETINGQPTPDSKTYEQALVYTKHLVEKWKKNSLITPAIAPHAPYTCPHEILVATEKFSQKYDVPLIIHVSETQKEVEKIIKEHGMRTVEYLNSLGLLNNRVIAAHCIHLNDDEIALLKQKRVGIAHAPISNMKLSSGIAPVYDMLKLGVLIGLGTDGAASNNALDMFGEMKTAALLQKVATGNPAALNAYQVLELATIGGARAVHMDDQIGSLEIGKKADIIIVAMDQMHQIPVYNVVSQLVYATKACDVKTVIINGNLVMDSRVIGTKKQRDQLRQKIAYFKKKIISLRLNTQHL